MEQRKVKREERLNHFLTLVSNKDPSVLLIQQEAEFLAAAVEPGKTASRKLVEAIEDSELVMVVVRV